MEKTVPTSWKLQFCTRTVACFTHYPGYSKLLIFTNVRSQPQVLINTVWFTVCLANKTAPSANAIAIPNKTKKNRGQF